MSEAPRLSEDAPEPVAIEDASASAPHWPQVRAFLEANPQLIHRDRELLQALGLKSAPKNVVEFGPAALAKLGAAAARESGARKALEAVARANFAAQTATHASVIEILESRNHSDLARRLDQATKERFGLVTGVIALEKPGAVPFGWRPLPERACDALLGEDGLSRLGQDVVCEELFGLETERVRSAAVVRIALLSPARQGLCAFGSADPEGFTPDMGAELVAFMARVVERTAERWPVL